MSRTEFHVDPKLEGEVVGVLEDAGFEVEVGNGPAVDFVVKKDIDCITLSDEAPEGWKPLPPSGKPDQLDGDDYKGGYIHKKDDVEIRIIGTKLDGSGHRFSYETILDESTQEPRYCVYLMLHPNTPDDRLIQSIHSGFEGDFEAARDKAREFAGEYDPEGGEA